MHKIYKGFRRHNRIRYGQPVFNNVNKFKKSFYGNKKKENIGTQNFGTFPILCHTEAFCVYRFWSDKVNVLASIKSLT